ncbi:DUF624 domain-containing protein [Georgenia halophila]|uniref:DUF624 domain-containing protein n=1 Tax=Georgenia halophila TaxID=620889 RepID=A0ABP8LHE8_9MICO
MTQPKPHHEPGQGVLSRFTGTVYWLAIVGVMLVVTTLPGTVPLMLLDRSASNIPLVALCLVPMGPAVSAGLFALRDKDRAEDMTPGQSFWRGYRLNAVDVLKLWIPALAVEVMVGISLANLDIAGVPSGYGLVLVILGVLFAVWAGQALVITSFFALRTRDVARLALYYLARTPLVGLGVLGMLVVTAGIVYLTFDAVLALVGPVLVWMLMRTCDRMVRHVEENFTA